MPNIYAVFSSTPYKMGRMIRCISGNRFNHVSISLDRELTQMYSFARRHRRPALYGGFVKESLARYYMYGKPSIVQICEISVSEAAYTQLKTRLEDMYAHRDQYLYNHLSIFSAPFRRWIRCRDARICTEFAVEILASVGVPINPGQCINTDQLLKIFADKTVYEGALPAPTEDDPEFFRSDPVPHSLKVCARDFFALFSRLEN